MRKGTKINSILDEGDDTGLFSQPKATLKRKSAVISSQNKTDNALTGQRSHKITKRKKAQTHTKVPSNRGRKKKPVRGELHEEEDKEVEEEIDARMIASRALKSIPNIGDEVFNRTSSHLDPSTISIITVNEKISKRLAHSLWQQLPSQVLQSLKSQIMELYMEPVVLQTSKTEKVRDRLRELLRQLVDELLQKLAVVKLPQIKNRNLLDLETQARKKLYLESVLSSNLKQVELLQRDLIKQEKLYNRDLVYFNDFSKSVEKDDLLKGSDLAENFEHELINFKRSNDAIEGDDDPDFDNVLSKLQKHLTSIAENTKELTALSDKVELVNELLQIM